MPWLPGMKGDVADWHLITYHFGDIRRYFAAGGKPEKLVVHFLSYDTGVINPLWGKATFHARVKRLQDAGVTTLITPDFSSWAEMPIVEQLWNHYRSLVVSCDLATAGFWLVPNVAWSAPQVTRLMVNSWPHGLPCVLVDANHIHTVEGTLNAQIFRQGLDVLRQSSPKRVIVYKNRPLPADWTQGLNVSWCPSRIAALSALRQKGRIQWRKAEAVAVVDAEHAQAGAGSQAELPERWARRSGRIGQKPGPQPDAVESRTDARPVEAGRKLRGVDV
jgi:hypothetical protein